MLDKLYVVTKNRGKLREFRELIRESLRVKVEALNVEKVELQSESLEDIALYSALNAYMRFKKPLIVEDAGLFIEALNGFPGAYSSYVYKTIGVKGVLKLMEDVRDRRACFKSVVAFAFNEGLKLFTGVVNGVISSTPRGSRGFGFDPIFVPEGSTKTFAEMTLREKNKYSHRGRAVRSLALWVREKFKV